MIEKPDYKNWVPKSMVYGLAGGTLAAFILFLLFGATGAILHGTPRLVCGIVLGIGTLVLLFFYSMDGCASQDIRL